jgi:hypothetical protein
MIVMPKQSSGDAVQQASAAVAAAEDQVGKLRDRLARINARQRDASAATNAAAAAHRAILGDRELGESPVDDADVARLREERRDAVHLEEGLTLAAQEIAARLKGAEHDLLACKHVLLEARIRDRCRRAQAIFCRVFEMDREAMGFVDALRALAAEAGVDRASLWDLDGTNVLLPDFSYAIERLPGDWHGGTVERGGAICCLLTWKGRRSVPHPQGVESARVDLSSEFPLEYPAAPAD